MTLETEQQRIASNRFALPAFELWLSGQLKEGLLSPFLSHVDISDEDLNKYQLKITEYLNGDEYRYTNLQKQFPLVSVWAISYPLSRNYGEKSHAVWPVIGEFYNALPETHYVRSGICKNFAKICDKHFLCYTSQGRPSNILLSQAGVAKNQFEHVVRTFWNSERVYGRLPDLDNTDEVNKWEDAAAEYLYHHTIAKMVLLADFQAYYATLYIRCRKNIKPRNKFETLFYAEVGNFADLSSESNALKPQVPLRWDNFVSLRMPEHPGSYLLRYALDDGSPEQPPRRLRRNQMWPLPDSWPKNVLIQHEMESIAVTVYNDFEDILIFQSGTGDYLTKVGRDMSGTIWVSEPSIVLVSQSSFKCGDAFSDSSTGKHTLFLELSASGQVVSFDSGHKLKLKIKPRVNGEVLNPLPLVGLNKRRVTLGRQSSIQIETSHADTEFWVKIINDKETVVSFNVEFEEELTQEICLADYFAPSDTVKSFRLEIKASENGRNLKVVSGLFFPMIEKCFGNSMIAFDPRSFAPSGEQQTLKIDPLKSSGILISGQGVGLDPKFIEDHAEITLQSGSLNEKLIWKNSNDRIEYFNGHGERSILPYGSEIEIEDVYTEAYIVIHSSSPTAKLKISRREELYPFKRRSSFVVRLAEFLSENSIPEIFLISDEVSIPVAKIRRSLRPSIFKISQNRYSQFIKLGFNRSIESIALKTIDLNSNEKLIALPLGHIPSSEPIPNWIKIDGSSDSIALEISEEKFETPTCLAEILVKPQGRDEFVSVYNDKSEGLCFGITGKNYREAQQRLSSKETHQIIDWLSRRMDGESRNQLNSKFYSRLSRDLEVLREEPSGQTRAVDIISNYFLRNDLPNPDGYSPLKSIPEAFGYDDHSFSAFHTNTKGADKLIAFKQIYAGRGLLADKVIAKGGAHPFLAAGFSNYAQANQNNTPLKNLTVKKMNSFFSGLPLVETSRPKKYQSGYCLSKEHYHFSIDSFLDRMTFLGFGSGIDEQLPQFSTLQRLPLVLRQRTIETIDWPKNIYSVYSDALQETIRLISNFAKECRYGNAREFIPTLSNQTGIQEIEIRSCLSLCLEAGLEIFGFYLLFFDIQKNNL